MRSDNAPLRRRRKTMRLSATQLHMQMTATCAMYRTARRHTRRLLTRGSRKQQCQLSISGLGSRHLRLRLKTNNRTTNPVSAEMKIKQAISWQITTQST